MQLYTDVTTSTENFIDQVAANCEARLECARAIKRTNVLRKKLSGDHMLRGQAHVERLLRDAYQTRRGKRWKICPADSQTLIPANA